MVKVSVIIPCFNQGKYIDECIDSVLNQTYNDLEIIIANDGSTDALTNEKLLRINNPRIQVISSVNKGVSNARNLAVKNSKGTYILPLDGDDKIERTYIEKAVKLLEKNEATKIVYCDITFFGSKTGYKILPPFDPDLFFTHNIIHVSGLFRRSDFDLVGGYDINMETGLEDWEFWISMLKSGGEVVKINEPLLYYRQYYNSRHSTLNRNPEETLKLLKYIENKHLDFYINYFGGPLVLASKLRKVKNRLSIIENSKVYKFIQNFVMPLKKMAKSFK